MSLAVLKLVSNKCFLNSHKPDTEDRQIPVLGELTYHSHGANIIY